MGRLWDRKNNPYSLSGKLIPMSEESVAFVSQKVFLRAITFDPKEGLDQLAQLFCYLSWENEGNTQNLQSFLRDMANDCEHNQIPDCFALLMPFLSIQDVLQPDRVEFLLSAILRILNKFKKYPKFTRTMITNCYIMANENDVVRLWLNQHLDGWSWTSEWMLRRGFRLPGQN